MSKIKYELVTKGRVTKIINKSSWLDATEIGIVFKRHRDDSNLWRVVDNSIKADEYQGFSELSEAIQHAITIYFINNKIEKPGAFYTINDKEFYTFEKVFNSESMRQFDVWCDGVFIYQFYENRNYDFDISPFESKDWKTETIDEMLKKLYEKTVGSLKFKELVLKYKFLKEELKSIVTQMYEEGSYTPVEGILPFIFDQDNCVVYTHRDGQQNAIGADYEIVAATIEKYNLAITPTQSMKENIEKWQQIKK